MKRNKMLIVFAFVFVLYALLCTFVYVKPERFFYKPYDYFGNIKNVQDDVLDISEVEYYDYGNMKVKGWLYLNKSKNSNSKVILFLHGNAYNLERYYHKLVPFADAGYSFFLPEYRGFGGQGVKIRQKFLTQDSLNAAKFLNQQGFANENIVVYGMSLGAHNALHTVVNSQQNGKYNALILEVPFTSLPDAAKSPDPPLLQNIQPPVPIVPSLLGQVVNGLSAILYIFLLKRSLR